MIPNHAPTPLMRMSGGFSIDTHRESVVDTNSICLIIYLKCVIILDSSLKTVPLFTASERMLHEGNKAFLRMVLILEFS